MDYIYSKNISVEERAGVVVCGGGVAGVAAAICASRNGADTVLIEKYGNVGGCMTLGLVGPFMTSYALYEEKQAVKGLFDEIVTRAEQRGGAIHPGKIQTGLPYASYGVRGHAHVCPFDPEVMKSLLLEMLVEAGVKVRLYTTVTDTICENGRVTGTVTIVKEGFKIYRGDVLIDCTGDGDLFKMAGAEYEIGREGDGLTQPVTIFLRIAGVDDEAVDHYMKKHPENYGRPFASILKETREKGDCPVMRDRIGAYKMLAPGEWRINTTRIIKKDSLSSMGLTEAELEGRIQVDAIMDWFKRYLPGFDKIRLISTGIAGVHESRRLVGAYTYTLEDMQSARHFEDVIALASYPMDIHSPDGLGGGILYREEIVPPNLYEIPFGILVPKEIEGLLVAGRCVSATHEALGAIRVMPPSIAMGQAAGTAAAIAVKDGILPRNVPIKKLQALLLAQDVVLS